MRIVQMQTKSDAIRGGQLCVTFVCMLVRVGSVTADDWPQWRGPNRDGVWKETNLVLLPEGARALWAVSEGGGFSSPVVADDRVYAFDAELQDPLSRRWVIRS
jgi:hypothetical protein